MLTVMWLIVLQLDANTPVQTLRCAAHTFPKMTTANPRREDIKSRNTSSSRKPLSYLLQQRHHSTNKCPVRCCRTQPG